MKLCYKCDDCGRYYDTEEEVLVCEKKHSMIRAKEEEKRLAKQKEKEELHALLERYIEMAGTLDRLGQEIADKSGYPFWWTYLDYVNNK